MALTPIITTGTASVANGGTAVTGAGAGWLSRVREGDNFGAHVGLSVPIQSVNNDNSITLSYPWPGVTQSNAPYAIAISSPGADVAASVRDLIEQLRNGNLVAFSGLAGVAGRVPVFTGPGTMALQDFSTVGTVTSVGVSVPTGFAASAAITTSGTIAITYSSGYEGFTTALKDLVNNSLGPGTNLAAIAAISATGHLVRTAAGTFATRTITGTANQITVANGTGISGNPTLSLPVAVTTSLGRADTALQASNFASNSDIDTGTSTTTVVNPAGAKRAAQTHTPASGQRFRAVLSADQTGIVTATHTLAAFATEVFDIGSAYNPATYRWTPAANKPVFMAAYARFNGGIVDQQIFVIAIRKNGTTVSESAGRASGTGEMSVPPVFWIDVPNGTDYYDVTFYGAGTGNKTVASNPSYTAFTGYSI